MPYYPYYPYLGGLIDATTLSTLPLTGPNTDYMRVDGVLSWSIFGDTVSDGVSRSGQPTPTATLVALAAAGRNPTDITLPTVGSQAVDPPPGSHEIPAGTSPAQPRPKPMTEAEAMAQNYVPDGVEPPASTNNGYLKDARDTVEGYGAWAYDEIFGKPLTKMSGRNWMTDRRSVWGNEQAFENGRAIGRATGLVMDAVITVSGVGGAVKGVITGIRAIQGAGGAIQVAQLLTNTGQTLNVVMVNGRAVEATAEVLASLGVSAEAAASLMASANNAGQGGSSPQEGPGNAPNGGGISRSEHAKLRSTQGRPVGQGVNDVQRAGPKDVFVQPEDGRFVVRGPNGREHIIEPNGELVTSLNRPNSAHVGQLRNGTIRPATEEELGALKGFVQ